ncbi:MAG: hypothetical protein ABW321_20945 [Polyangiales bacterium]
MPHEQTAAAAAQPLPPTELRVELDGSLVELTDIPIAPLTYPVAPNKVLRKAQIAEVPVEQRGTLLGLCYELFVGRWNEVQFGPCIQGSVFELQLGAEPSHISYLDGYLTLYLEQASSHMHLCLGAHTGLKHTTPSELARVRQCTRVAFARTLGENRQPHSWAIQLWNGAGEQMITFFLPSPFLDMERQKRLREPVWSHLDLWNDLRARYLGERTPQPLPIERGSGGCG